MTQGYTPQFRRKALVDCPAALGARWWHEALVQQAGQTSRRNMIIGLAAGGAAFALLSVGVASCASTCCCRKSGSSDTDPADLVETKQDALDAQVQLGWDVGASDKELVWPGALEVNCDGQKVQSASEVLLLERDLTPTQARLVPFYGPTLFRAPGNASGKGLATVVKPVATSEMNVAFARARGLASEFDGTQRDLVVVVDVPGPEAVAAAAGLAERFEPVFVFDNWPHPAGVVPSHLVLGAALYYRSYLLRAAKARRADSPPVFVLDSNRLLPYTDDATQFDNRYTARIPSWTRLRELGLRRLLYVRPDGEHKLELDDFNADFCSCAVEEIDLKLCLLGDFRPSTEPTPQAPIPVQDAGQEGGAPPMVANATPHYYGGHPHTHIWFWHDYGWYAPRTRPPGTRPVALGSTYAYKPVSRQTIFTGMRRQSSGALGKPANFGFVTLNKSKSSGSVVSVGRSGSLGRVGGGSSTTGGGYHPSSGG